MTADDAATTWNTRAMEILSDFKSSGPTASLWQQADLAANGDQALLANRYTELSPEAQDQLRRIVDAMADVKTKSLGAAEGDPLSDATEEFFSEVKRRAVAGGQAVATASKVALVGGIGLVGVLLIAYAILVLKR